MSLTGLLSAEAAPVTPMLPLLGDAASVPRAGTLLSSCSVVASGSCLVEVADAALPPAPGMSISLTQQLQYNTGPNIENTEYVGLHTNTMLAGGTLLADSDEHSQQQWALKFPGPGLACRPLEHIGTAQQKS